MVGMPLSTEQVAAKYNLTVEEVLAAKDKYRIEVPLVGGELRWRDVDVLRLQGNLQAARVAAQVRAQAQAEGDARFKAWRDANPVQEYVNPKPVTFKAGVVVDT